MTDPTSFIRLVNCIRERYTWDNGHVIDEEHQGRWDREKLATLHTVIQKATVNLFIDHGKRGNVVLGSLPTIKMLSYLKSFTRSPYYGRSQENPVLTCYKNSLSMYASIMMSNNMLIVGCTNEPKREPIV